MCSNNIVDLIETLRGFIHNCGGLHDVNQALEDENRERDNDKDKKRHGV